MKPNLKSFVVRGRYIVGANVGLRVIGIEPDANIIRYDVDLGADCMDDFFLSEDGGVLAAGFAYEHSRCITITGLQEQSATWVGSPETELLRINRVHALDLRLAPDGQHLFFWNHATKSATYVVNVQTGERTKIPLATFPTNGAWLPDSVVLPLDRGKGGVRVSYRTLDQTPIDLPSKTNVRRLVTHPSGQTIAMMDRRGRIASLAASTLKPMWERTIPSAGWVSYSGDGRFMAVQDCAANGGFKSILLLESESGQIMEQLNEPDGAHFPLYGPRFLCYSGRFLNGETGEFDEGVSSPSYWKSLLKSSGGESTEKRLSSNE